MAETQGTPPAPRTPRWLKLVLFASLALNLAVLGLVAGTVINRGPPHRAEAPPGVVYMRALPAEDRRAVFRSLRDARRGLAQPGREGARALEMLRADPFDAAGFAALIERQNRQGDALRDAGQAALIARLDEMGPEGRAAYADRLEESFAQGPRRKR
ncbi:periplasmic heavy metal sensor [Roseivivax sp.]